MNLKNFLKLFGIIASVAVIGFSLASCDFGDIWEPSSGTFPAEWMPNTSTSSITTTTTWKWSNDFGSYLQINSSNKGWIYLGTADVYKITGMTRDKQGIRVKKLNDDNKPTGKEITLCTGWTVKKDEPTSPYQLTLTGIDTKNDFDVFKEKEEKVFTLTTQ